MLWNGDYHFSYVGLFIDRQELRGQLAVQERRGLLRRKGLEQEYPYPHVTFAYHPKNVDEELFGTRAQIIVTGYGCDGANEGLRVEVMSTNPRLMEAYRQIEVPHITLSLSCSGNAVDTSRLLFEPVPHFFLAGSYGGFWKKKDRPVFKLHEYTLQG